MKLSANPFSVLLGVIMLGLGIASFFGYRLLANNLYMQYGAFAIAALLLILVVTGRMKEGVGWVLLAMWLILTGLTGMFRLNYVYDDIVISGLPLLAGLFLLFGI
jgi:hypothetical protein